MAADQDLTQGGTSDQETAWLSQYYTNSKTEEAPVTTTTDDGPAAAELLAPAAGEKYAITGQVGVGGMKTIHRAHDQHADRDVALARLRKDAPRSSHELRFLREARITAALEHPNIVPVHEIGLDAANHPYFTMKLLGGENLHDILTHIAADDPAYSRLYPLGRRLEIFQNVCHAIAFAHSRGVVHLDLKPPNIQVASFGEVLVLDWGLAKVLDRGLASGIELIQLPELLREVPKAGTVSGTPGYMAPEQARGDFLALDQRTDIFALGAVLQALINGCPSQPQPTASPQGSPGPGRHCGQSHDRGSPPALPASGRLGSRCPGIPRWLCRFCTERRVGSALLAIRQTPQSNLQRDCREFGDDHDFIDRIYHSTHAQ